jgi:para-nitrobenzyl esterase
VSVTYRLGILGFFSHPLLSAESPNGVSGNYGVMDQAAALKWITDNIAQFGGDPANITIFGQSAGGGSVQTLLASPQSRNMIAKAISMSAGGLSESRPSAPFETVQHENKALMDHFGKTTLPEMRALSFDELTRMTTEYAAATGTRLGYRPVVENYFLTGSFGDMARAGQLPDIPYMFGFTANDMSDMVNPIRDFCLLREQQGGKPAYAYLFTRQLPGDESGAFHSADLWYVFNSLRHSWRPFTAGDKELGVKMIDCWTNFAKYGNPNGQGAADWTPCTSSSPQFMVFDADQTKAILTMTGSPTYLGPSLRR